jgi:hypothetical protein
MKPFRGTYTVMVTPFTETGEIDVAALWNFVNWQIAEGIDGLIPLGSTGEFLSLSDAEHELVAHTVIREAAGRVPVLIGTGAGRLVIDDEPGIDGNRAIRPRDVHGVAVAAQAIRLFVDGDAMGARLQPGRTHASDTGANNGNIQRRASKLHRVPGHCEIRGWVAYPLFALDPTGENPSGWLAIAAPVFMYWLLVRVSGIPPLEQHMLRSRGDVFRRYQARVSAFFPIPPGWHS